MKVVDLAVVGGGYWGTAIALRAKEKGYSVVVLDDRDPRAGSRNASAVCDPEAYQSAIFEKYWPRDWSKEDLTESLDWLLKRGGKMVREYFWNLPNGSKPREKDKAIYLDSNEAFLGQVESVKATVLQATRERVGWEIQTGEGLKIIARTMAVAAGYRTDEVLTRINCSVPIKLLGVKPLLGRGIVVQGVSKVPVPISVMTRPYTKHTLRSWDGDYFRVGDTAPRDLSKPAGEDIKELGKVAQACLGSFYTVGLISGLRPVCNSFMVESVGPRLVAATGGHRLGLGLSGLVALKVLRKLM